MWRGRMCYESGMSIVFDVLSKSVVIVFRGEVIMLPGPFQDRKAAIAAAEDHCRKLGWRPMRPHR